MANFTLTTKYEDGSVRSFTTGDGALAVREAGNACYEEEQAKTVALEQDGKVLFSDSIKAYKPSSR